MPPLTDDLGGELTGVMDDAASVVAPVRKPVVVGEADGDGDEGDEAGVEVGRAAWVVPSFIKTPRPWSQQEEPSERSPQQ